MTVPLVVVSVAAVGGIDDRERARRRTRSWGAGTRRSSAGRRRAGPHRAAGPQGHLGGIDGDRGALRGSVSAAPRCHATAPAAGANCRPTGRATAVLLNPRTSDHGRADNERDAKYRREACPAPAHTSILPACAARFVVACLRAEAGPCSSALVTRSPRTTADQAGDSGRTPQAGDSGRRNRKEPPMALPLELPS